jgi:hypothetical protein
MPEQITPTKMAPYPSTHQTTDHAVDGTEERRLLLLGEEHVHAHPGEKGRRRGDVGVEHRRGSVDTCVVRVTTVEAVPAQPQDAGTDGDEHEVVRHAVGAVPSEPWPDDGRSHEAGHAGRQVDHVATRVVDRALLGEEPAAPEQRRVHGVDEGDPQGHEEQPRLELHAPEHTAQEQQRRDRGEHELEVRERRRREVERDQGICTRDRLVLLTEVAHDGMRMADEA